MIVRDAITPAMQQLAREYPKEFQRGLLAVGQRWRRILATEMKAGNPAGQRFAPLSAMTIALRHGKLASIRSRRRRLKAEGVSSKSRRGQRLTQQRNQLSGFGGRLPQLAEFATVNGVQVGWLGQQFPGINKAVARWQRSELRAWTTGERHVWHKIFGEKIPDRQYHRQARPPVEPQQGRFVADAQSTITKTVKALVAYNARRARAGA